MTSTNRQSDDPGIRTVNRLSEVMQVDDKWSIHRGRGFTWWPHWFKQRVWAEDPMEDEETRVWRVRVETDFLVAPRMSAQREDFLGKFLQLSTLSGAVKRPKGVVALHSVVYVHEGNQPWLADLLALAAALQLSEGPRWAHAMIKEFELDRAISAHPKSGSRDEADEMVDAAAPLIEMGQLGNPSDWAQPSEFEQALELLQQVALMATGDSSGLTAEFPFGPDSAPAAVGGTSSLMTVSTVDAHPLFGAGLVCRLNLPTSIRSRGKTLGPVGLNALEADRWARSHLLGSWCKSPNQGELVFVSYLPNSAYRPALLTNLVLSMALRARWVDSLMGSGSN